MVDTQIWVFRKKIPLQEKYDNSVDYQNALKLHQKAIEFFDNLLKKTIIYFTTHQIGELFHVFAFRGLRIPLDETFQFIYDLMHSKNTRVIPITDDDLTRAINLSAKSNIHIWDYLCIIPLTNYVSKIYTTDSHFKDESFIQFGIDIENPLNSWEVQ